jgi:hypothetical protein
MKRILIVLAIALAVGCCAYAWMKLHKEAERQSSSLLEAMPELAYLREELDLSDSQFKKVSDLHAAYRPKCREMCERIAKAHVRLDDASRGMTEVTPQLKEAIEDHARIHAECQEEMLAHLYETARVLDEKQARRYLEVMLPYALDFSHSEPEEVHVH